MHISKISDCNIIKFSENINQQGNISIAQNDKLTPFEIKRIFYLFDIPSGNSRGAHAHVACHQILICPCGSFDVLLDDGINQKILTLNKPNEGLHIVPGIWASELNFTSGSVCLVLTSHIYDESDYIRNYEEFKLYKKINYNGDPFCKS